jgi:hypothetical protein
VSFVFGLGGLLVVAIAGLGGVLGTQTAGDRPREVLYALLVVTSLTFLASFGCALSAIGVLNHTYADRKQLREQWQVYRDRSEQPGSARLTEVGALGLLVNQLIDPEDGESAVDTIAKNADDRGERVKWSLRFFGVGVLLLGVVGLGIVLESGFR